MNRNYANRRRATPGVGAGCAAALIGLGAAATAMASPSTDADPFADLFGSANESVPNSPGFTDALRDEALNQSYPTFAQQFDANVDAFENANFRPFSDFVNAIDPNAFTVQSDPDFSNGLTSYLVPTDVFGYEATEMDYALTGSGLTYLFNPEVDWLMLEFPFQPFL